ncbi:hypothetical protein [Streptomyces sp. YIM 98790]|uniref:hypothetical protein n=1 Tax=Streptomyces sp. YIM 98790 TaxID=2689077 RepID=UPI00140E6083|nr:hypothetical protein [Streptomyces sp. YIM 98790]
MEPEAGDALSSLIRWVDPLDTAIEAANRCDLSEGPSVSLDRPAVRSVLHRCISGELDVQELPRWAGAVHMLDRVEIEEQDIELLTQFLFEISTPELFVPVTVDVCQRWIDRLE